MANLQKINDLRKEKNYTWNDLSEKLGISLAGVQKIIASNSTKIETLEKIADFFQVPVRYFFEDIQKDELNTEGFKSEINRLIDENKKLQHLSDLYSGLIENTSETFGIIFLVSQFTDNYKIPDSVLVNHDNPIKFVSDFNKIVKESADKWTEEINKEFNKVEISKTIRSTTLIQRLYYKVERFFKLD